MVFGWKVSREDSCRLVARAIDAGINLIDTSNSYGRGKSEELTGQALRETGQRHRIILATKVHTRMADDDPNAFGNSRRHIIEECESSLRRLQTDYIDLYQIHRPQSSVPIDESLRALDDLVRAGKVRYIGTSTFAAWQLVESLWVAKELGINRFVCEQPPYNLLDRSIERELIPMAQTYGFGVITWSPLAEGLLTGKYERNTAIPADSRFGMATNSASYQGRLTDAVFDVIEKLKPIANNKNCTLPQLALAWCVGQSGITGALIGPASLDQLEDNLKGLNVRLSDEERVEIDKIVAPGSSVTQYYAADFGPHNYRW
jgi:aryl-alcohol dehydrogenase-like predicted oxidoreductase